MKHLRKRLTYANVMSSIAVFLVVGGATAFAALSKNSVGSKQLKKNAVTTNKIKKNAVTTAKIKADAVTGAKVNESSLGTVPSATSATNAVDATNATNADNFDKYVPFGVVTVNKGESRVLVSYGPFSLIGQCIEPAASLGAYVVFTTTEEHTSFGGDDESSGDMGPATPESERIIENPGASSSGTPENSDGYDDQFNAQAPSGRSWAGTVESWASKDASQCRWSGFILKTS